MQVDGQVVLPGLVVRQASTLGVAAEAAVREVSRQAVRPLGDLPTGHPPIALDERFGTRPMGGDGVEHGADVERSLHVSRTYVDRSGDRESGDVASTR